MVCAFSWRIMPKAIKIKTLWKSWNYQFDLGWVHEVHDEHHLARVVQGLGADREAAAEDPRAVELLLAGDDRVLLRIRAREDAVGGEVRQESSESDLATVVDRWRVEAETAVAVERVCNDGEHARIAGRNRRHEHAVVVEERGFEGANAQVIVVGITAVSGAVVEVVRRAERPEDTASSSEDAFPWNRAVDAIPERDLATGIVDRGSPEIASREVGLHAVDQHGPRVGIVRRDGTAGAGEKSLLTGVELRGERDLARVVERGIETKRTEPSSGRGDGGHRRAVSAEDRDVVIRQECGERSLTRVIDRDDIASEELELRFRRVLGDDGDHSRPVHAGDHVPRAEPIRRRPRALERDVTRVVDRCAGEGSWAKVVVHVIDQPGEVVASSGVSRAGETDDGK